MTAFHFRVNGRDEMVLESKTGIYVEAVAAIPAMFDIRDYPLDVEIWVPHLVPQYGPYYYRIKEPGARVVTLVRNDTVTPTS